MVLTCAVNKDVYLINETENGYFIQNFAYALRVVPSLQRLNNDGTTQKCTQKIVLTLGKYTCK